ncbi:hypothetical protein pdam_00022463, partial [Pocillopora damicornis]
MPANHKTTNPSKMIQLQRVPFLESGEIPTWTNIMKDSTTWKVSFDMVDDLPNAHRSAFNIGHDKTRLVRLYKSKWYKSDRNNSFHLFGVYSNSNTNKRLQGIENFLSSLTEEMIGTQLARVYKFSTRSDKRSTSSQPPKSVQPCRVKWSNALRFDPTDTKGKCLHFTASLFVVSAAFPKEPDSPSLVQISPGMISTYNKKQLFRYFSKDVFGNDQSPAKVMNAHIVSRPLTKAECKGDTVKDLETNICVQKCHKDCDPLA